MNTDQAFEALREANPVSVGPPPSEAEELFAAITATQPDGGRRGPSRGRRAVLALAAAVICAAAGAAAAPAVSSWIGEIVGAPEVNADYDAAKQSLPLPPGYTWPRLGFGEDDVSSRGAGGGFAVSIAQTAWECYWVQSLSRNDAAGERRAEAALDNLMKNNIVVAPPGASENWSPSGRSGPTAVYANDGGYEHKQRIYADAAAGKPQLLAESCRANRPPGWSD